MFSKSLKIKTVLLALVLAPCLMFGQFAKGDDEKDDKKPAKPNSSKKASNIYFFGGYKFPMLNLGPKTDHLSMNSLFEGSIFILDNLEISGKTTLSSAQPEENEEFKSSELSIYYAPIAFFSENYKLDNVFNKTSLGLKFGWINNTGYANNSIDLIDIFGNNYSERIIDASTTMYYLGFQRLKQRFRKADKPTRMSYISKLYLDFTLNSTSTGIVTQTQNSVVISASEDITNFLPKNNFGWRIGWSFYKGFSNNRGFWSRVGWTGQMEYFLFPGINVDNLVNKADNFNIGFGLAMFI